MHNGVAMGQTQTWEHLSARCFTCDLERQQVLLPYSWKYWREIILVVKSQITITNILARFKFGGLIQDHHRFICMEEILADFNLAVGRLTAKPPNLNHRQIFRLYGMFSGLNNKLKSSMLVVCKITLGFCSIVFNDNMAA